MSMIKEKQLLHNHHKGFTLFEVLIALLVFSIGLLGAAGLQLTAVKNNKSAHSITVASIFAQDIADRARANVVRTNMSAIEASRNLYAHDGLGAVPQAASGCEIAGGSCTTTDMANTDLNQWLTALTTSPDLPNARGIICVDSVPERDAGVLPSCDDVGDITVVYIDWTDEANATGARNQRFVLSFNII